jgi:hypothetical protein
MYNGATRCCRFNTEKRSGLVTPLNGGRSKLEDVPEFNGETGLVLRNKVQRSEKDLDVNIEHRSGDRLREVIIFQKEHGYDGYVRRYYFAFTKAGCWFLYALKGQT